MYYKQSAVTINVISWQHYGSCYQKRLIVGLILKQNDFHQGHIELNVLRPILDEMRYTAT